MSDREQRPVLRRIESAWDWWERFYSFLGQVGARQVIGSTLLFATLGIWTWFRDNVPWYLAVLLALAMTATALFVVHQVQIIRATAKYNTRDYRALGRELVGLSEEIFRFLVNRQRDQAGLHTSNPEDMASHSSWQADRDFEQVTGSLFFENFGPRVLGLLAILQRIGVSMPPHMISTAQRKPRGLSQFLGVIGHLLAQGNVSDAVEISKDRDFMWQIQH